MMPLSVISPNESETSPQANIHAGYRLFHVRNKDREWRFKKWPNTAPILVCGVVVVLSRVLGQETYRQRGFTPWNTGFVNPNLNITTGGNHEIMV